jgi:hypothetical protein
MTSSDLGVPNPCSRSPRTNASSPHSGEPIARVAPIAKIKFQCSQILEKEVHNERVVYELRDMVVRPHVVDFQCERRCTMNASSTDSAASCR